MYNAIFIWEFGFAKSGNLDYFQQNKQKICVFIPFLKVYNDRLVKIMTYNNLLTDHENIWHS